MCSEWEKEVGWGAYVDGPDEVFIPHEDVRDAEAEDDGVDPRAHETLHDLLRGELDELRAAEGHAADLGEDVVRDDQRGRE